MEGNDCYKFSTIRNWVQSTGSREIKNALEIGANVGDVTALLLEFFPTIHVWAVEVVPEYHQLHKARFAGNANVRSIHGTATSQHLFSDDIGCQRRPAPSTATLQLLRGLPAAGGGYVGGSIVAECGQPFNPAHYHPEAIVAPVATFDELVEKVLSESKENEIDYVKFDCEGCEHSCLDRGEVPLLNRRRAGDEVPSRLPR